MYITPTRFRSLGLGNDLTSVSDAELRAVINRASALVNSFCAVSMIPSAHDFRGGSITAEQHNWRLPDLLLLSQAGGRRVYPYHAPLKTITSFIVKFTQTYQVQVDPANLYVNQSEGWAEVVSIAAIVTGVYPVGISFGLYTPVAEVGYTYGWVFSITGDVCEEVDARTYQGSNQFWVTSPTPKVYVNDVLQSSGYAVNSAEGTVIFTSTQAPGSVVTADYSYPLPPAIADATALVTSDLLGERDLIAKGMAGIASLHVAEVELRRTFSPFAAGTATMTPVINPRAAELLAPYVQVTAR